MLLDASGEGPKVLSALAEVPIGMVRLYNLGVYEPVKGVVPYVLCFSTY